jgi:hypothetical protein
MSALNRHIATGGALAAATVLLAWFYTRVGGRAFGSWSWTTLAFTLLVAQVLILAGVAVASGPFEPRLRRWNAASDPLAIGFQLDLAATERNPPARVGIEARWLWMALLPALAAGIVGAAMARDSTAGNRAPLIPDVEAVAIAEQALTELLPPKQSRALLGYELTTAADAAAYLRDAVPFAVTDSKRVVFVVYFTTEALSKPQSSGAIQPGPTAVIDAETGQVLGTGVARYRGGLR